MFWRWLLILEVDICSSCPWANSPGPLHWPYTHTSPLSQHQQSGSAPVIFLIGTLFAMEPVFMLWFIEVLCVVLETSCSRAPWMPPLLTFLTLSRREHKLLNGVTAMGISERPSLGAVGRLVLVKCPALWQEPDGGAGTSPAATRCNIKCGTSGKPSRSDTKSATSLCRDVLTTPHWDTLCDEAPTAIFKAEF